jgi:hypothetical protein
MSVRIQLLALVLVPSLLLAARLLLLSCRQLSVVLSPLLAVLLSCLGLRLKCSCLCTAFFGSGCFALPCGRGGK